MSDTIAVLKLIRFLFKLVCLNIKIPCASYLVSILILSLICTNARAVYMIATEVRDVKTVVDIMLPAVIFVLCATKLTNISANEEAVNEIFEIVSKNLIQGCTRQQIRRVASAGSLSYFLVRGLLIGINIFNFFYAFCYFYSDLIDGNGFRLTIVPFFKHFIPGDGNIFFASNYILQFVVAYIATVVTTISDGTLTLSLIHLDAGLDVFTDKVNNFNEDNATKDLRELWKYQVTLKRFKILIEDSFKAHISVQFISSMGVLCVSLYGLQGETMIPMMVMVVLALLEIFIICYLGQLINHKSDTIMNQLYSLPWIGFSRANSRRLLIMMMASKDAMTVTAPFATLTLQSFSQVLKTTYSLYALKNNADQK